jgi:predicted O-methyltransferase YrrM
LESGQPTIYDRFRANINSLGLNSQIVPLVCTSIVGLKLINRLRNENRISKSPNVIYLDSAHEADETFLELKNCWDVLDNGGVIFGDDWSWDAVRNDVKKFSATIQLNYENVTRAIRHFRNSALAENGIVVEAGQWILFK